MLKHTIDYTDFNGTKRSEEFYFNLTQTEALELETSVDEGFSDMLKRIAETEDRREMIQIFKKIILLSYGLKSDDGRRFIKSDQLREDFQQTAAFSALYMSFITDANMAAKFINGIIPDVSDIEKKLQPQDHLPKQVSPAQAITVVDEVHVTKDDGMAEYLAWKAAQDVQKAAE